MTDEIEFRRCFEQFWAEQHELRPQDVAEYRMTDGSYRLPGIASHWRTYKRACEDLRGEVVELPSDQCLAIHSYDAIQTKQYCQRAMEAAGVKHK